MTILSTPSLEVSGIHAKAWQTTSLPTGFPQEGVVKFLYMPKFRPPHLYRDETIYFLSGRTVSRQPFLKTNENKENFLKIHRESLLKFNVKIFAFVINNDHYHLLVMISEGMVLPKFIANLHANSARLINKGDRKESRKIWYQYWDRCVRSEKDFWIRFNYIHHNPIKHGYVENQNELSNYNFCSYGLWQKKMGQKWLDSIFEFYPIKDFTLKHND
jgi:putative transposase